MGKNKKEITETQKETQRKFLTYFVNFVKKIFSNFVENFSEIKKLYRNKKDVLLVFAKNLKKII